VLYNYFPDVSPFSHRSLFPDSLWEYDCVFYTKCSWDGKPFLARFRDAVFVPHGYDPEVHRPWRDAKSLRQYQHEVTFVGTYSTHKEEVLERLVSAMPALDLAVWGAQWSERCHSERLMQHIQGYPVIGTTYAKVLSAANINFAIMGGGMLKGGVEGDQTSTRTYEIPACRGFMMHERTPELLTLFEEGKEVVCFDSTREAVEKIRYYLDHPAEREAIAGAAYARCVPAYSYDNRMAKILRWHATRAGRREAGK